MMTQVRLDFRPRTPHNHPMRETDLPMEAGGADGGNPYPLELWNRAEPRAVINLVPGALANAMLEAGKARPDLFGMDERTLWKQLRSDSKQPTATDNRLRIKFWDEYDRAQADNSRMEVKNIFAGICVREYFYGHYLAKPEKVAWMMCAPASYEVKMEEALAFGIEQLRDILELDHVSASGRIDVKLLELKAKIVAMMDQRVKGAVVQRVENKNMNLNISTSDQTVAKKAMAGTMEQIEKRLKELDSRDRYQAKQVAQAKEAEVVDE